MPTAPAIVQVFDDVPGFTGIVPDGGLTNDTMPTVRVSLAGAGVVAGDTIQLRANAAALGSATTVTQEQIAAGYLDITTAGLPQGAVELTATASGASGSATSPGYDLRIDSEGPINQDVTAVYDDDGLVAKYSVTNDRTLIAETRLSWNGDAAYAAKAGDSLQLLVDGVRTGAPIAVTAQDIANGYARIAVPEVGYGDHWFRVEITDEAGNPGSNANAYPLTIAEKLPPEIIQVIDDTAPQTGAVADGGFTNDTVVTARISLADTKAQAGDVVVLTAQGHETAVTLTSAQVSAGFVDVNSGFLAISSSGREGWTQLNSQVRYAHGQLGLVDIYRVRLATDAPDAPVFEGAIDDAGASTGALATGAATDDTTPTFNLRVDTDPGAAWQPPPPPPSGSPGHPSPPPHYSATVGAPVDLYANGAKVGSGVVDDGSLQITSSQLSAGTYTFTALATDKAGNQSQVSSPFSLTIAADGSSPPPPAGQVLTSDQYGDQLIGGAGADTLNAGQGPDTLTGNGGGDVFAFAKLPWNSGRVTDFAVGTDRIDLSALFRASGYTGSDPVADGYVSLQTSGTGGTTVFYDTDGRASGNTIQFRITTLDGVSPNGLTWAQVSGVAGPTNPNPNPDHTPSIVGVGGGALPAISLNEAHLASGTAPQPGGSTQNASVVLNAADGVKDLYIASTLVISNGVFQPTSYVSSGTGVRIDFRSYDAASGRLDMTFNLNGPLRTSVGPDGVHTAFALSLTDRDGDTSQGRIETVIYDDVPYLRPDEDVLVVGSTAPATGNVVTDASFSDQGDADNGVDRFGADGGQIIGIYYAGGGVTVGSVIPTEGISYNGQYGRLTMYASGNYSYAPNGQAQAGASETFSYKVRDGDGDEQQASLRFFFDPPANSNGVVLTSQQPGSRLNGGAGNDTLNAGQGEDVLTGNGGADAFVYSKLPWSSGHATDFTVGTDRLDLSALFQGSGYTGSNPIADGYVTLQANGPNTLVLYDTDGPASGNTIQFRIVTLDNVPTAGLTWAQLSGGATAPPPPPPPPPGDPSDQGRVINSQREGDTLVGGGGGDTLNAGQGPDTLTGAGGADHLAFGKVPWNAGHVTDFTPGVDKLDLRGIFAASGYGGSDPIADRYLRFEGDGVGGTRVLVDIDGPGGPSPYQFVITTLDHVTPGQISAGDWIFH
jgi:hypothetical protein